MIYGECLTEQMIDESYNIDSFELELIKENLDTLLDICTYSVVTESFVEKAKQIIDNIIEYIKKIFNILSEKVSKFIMKIKTFFDIEQYKKYKNDGVIVKNVEMIDLTSEFNTLESIIRYTSFNDFKDDIEAKSAREYENEYIQKLFSRYKDIRSINDITMDRLLKRTIKDLTKYEISLQCDECSKYVQSASYNTFKNIGKYKNEAVNRVKDAYVYINNTDSKDIQLKLLRLKSQAHTYGKLCSLYVSAVVEYLKNVNKLKSYMDEKPEDGSNDDISNIRYKKRKKNEKKDGEK